MKLQEPIPLATLSAIRLPKLNDSLCFACQFFCFSIFSLTWFNNDAFYSNAWLLNLSQD